MPQDPPRNVLFFSLAIPGSDDDQFVYNKSEVIKGFFTLCDGGEMFMWWRRNV